MHDNRLIITKRCPSSDTSKERLVGSRSRDWLGQAT
jgi:hypothetical protein